VNLPNALSAARIVLAAFLTGLLIAPFPYATTAAFIVFVVAAITDTMDGRLARRNGQVTPLGMLLDPLADKVLVCAALVSFVEIHAPGAHRALIPAWTAIVILSREFLVTGLRALGGRNGHDIPAGTWGKHKTAWQMLFIAASLLALAWLRDGPPAASPAQAALWGERLTVATRAGAAAIAVLTAVSGVVYFRRHAALLRSK